jgi:anti-anti-sigma factor
MPTSTTLHCKQTRQDDALILELGGAIDSAASLDTLVEVVRKAGSRNVVLVLSGVDYINSAGFGALVNFSSEMSRLGLANYIVGLQDKIHVVFNSLGARNTFNILPTLNDALAMIRSSHSGPAE